MPRIHNTVIHANGRLACLILACRQNTLQGMLGVLNRLNWARVHTRWIRRRWNTVLFSDESRLSLQRGDGRVRVYRRRNVRYADCCVLERDRFGGGGSVMVWAAIAHGYRSPISRH